jgi:hypothetical protein
MAQSPEVAVVPVTVYKMQASVSEPVPIREGGSFSVRLAKISREFRTKGNVSVRAFEGTKAELIKRRESRVGNCYRFDPFATYDGHIDGFLDLKDIVDVQDTWLECGHGPCRSKRWVLVPEDGKVTASPLYIDEGSIADYFNGGIEIEVRPGGAVTRIASADGGTAVVAVGVRGDGRAAKDGHGTNVAADAPASVSAPALPRITVTCYKFSTGPGTEVAKEKGVQIAEVRSCATL